MENTKISTYNNWCVLYKNNKIIGYVHNAEEANKICQTVLDYSWEYGLNNKNNKIYDKPQHVNLKL